MVITGGFLSILLPPIRPAVELLPATSTTCCWLVKALFVSVRAGTEVKRLKFALAATAKPERASLAVQAIEISEACHRPSAAPQLTTGGVLSTLTGWVAVKSFPTLSVHNA